MIAWLERQLSRRGARHAPLLAAFLLTAVAVPSGRATEDWVFQSVARGQAHLFPWVVNLWGSDALIPESERPGVLAYLKMTGLTPWIAYERFKVVLWRPLASLTHHLDYRLAPDSPWIWHLHSLLWYVALVAAVGALYRRLLPQPWIATLATLLYAIDDAHGHTVGWVMNRNALVAALLGVLALVAHDRARRDGWRPGRWLAPLGLALALGASEYGVAVIAYFVAHSLTLDPGRGARRWLPQLGWIGVVGAWAWLYRAAGSGTVGSGVYLDPLSNPLGFARSAGGRFVALLGGQIAGPPSDLWNDPPPPLWLVAGLACLVILFLAPALWRAATSSAELRFFGLGALGALLPLIAAFPEDRLLVLPGIGAFAVLAALISGLVAAERPVWLTLVVAHLVIAPLLLPWRSLTMARYEARLALARSSALAAPSPEVTDLVLLSAPDYFFGAMIRLTATAAGEKPPKHVFVLAGTTNSIEVERPDPNSLLVRPAGGYFARTFNRIYRGENYPLAVGQGFVGDGVEFKVMELDARGAPATIRFRFGGRLEAARFRFLQHSGGRYVPFVLPPVGARVVVGAD